STRETRLRQSPRWRRRTPRSSPRAPRRIPPRTRRRNQKRRRKRVKQGRTHETAASQGQRTKDQGPKKKMPPRCLLLSLVLGPSYLLHDRRPFPFPVFSSIRP